MRQKAEIIAKEHDISFGWGRIFYVYGKNEVENRLGGALANKLARNEVVTINSAQLQTTREKHRSLPTATTSHLWKATTERSEKKLSHICTRLTKIR